MQVLTFYYTNIELFVNYHFFYYIRKKYKLYKEGLVYFFIIYTYLYTK